MVTRHGDNDGRGYHDGAGAAASAMVRESEGEELRRERRVCELGGGVGDRSRAAALRGEEAGRRAAAWHACCARRRAAACLPGQAKQLAGAVAGLGRQVGLLGGAR